MRRCVALIWVVWLVSLCGVSAQSLDDQYIAIFNLIQEADGLLDAHPGDALSKYLQARQALERLQRGSPDWNAKVVNFRLAYVGAKIEALTAKGVSSSVNGTNRPTASPATPAAVPGDWEQQMNALKEQVRQLQADKIVLESKLKESLAAQPAESDPRELAKAEEKIRSLQKENELLKLAADKAKEAPAAETKATSAEGEALRAENQLLKKQLADLQSGSPPSGKGGQAERQLASARAQIATLQSDMQVLRLERAALQNRVTQLTASAPPGGASAPAAAAVDANRIKQLEQERDDLQKQLDAANQLLAGKKIKGASARVKELQAELAGVRARLATYEAKAVPYSAEELALFQSPAPKLPQQGSAPQQKSGRQLSAATAQLVLEARRFYLAGDYEKAESKYAEVLKEDEKNVGALCDLASIQLEANHLAAADGNIKQALVLAPENAYALTVLGRLRTRQGSYDEAVEALARAAKLEPENAETQNFLGLALSEKGLRGPAETALRKAIQLEPNYAAAHNNLAVVYISQKPPAVELARWHYQRARAAGAPRNARLEKLIEEAK